MSTQETRPLSPPTEDFEHDGYFDRLAQRVMEMDSPLDRKLSPFKRRARAVGTTVLKQPRATKTSTPVEYKTAYGFKPGEFDIWREVEDEGDAPLPRPGEIEDIDETNEDDVPEAPAPAPSPVDRTPAPAAPIAPKTPESTEPKPITTPSQAPKAPGPRAAAQSYKPAPESKVPKNASPEKDKGKVLTPTEANIFLSYPDVLEGQQLRDSLEYVATNPSAKKYSEALVKLSELYDGNEVLYLATQLRDGFLGDAKELGLEPSLYGKSQSWALWDIAKQYYLSEHPEESNADLYELGNPFNPSRKYDKIRGQIVYRHLGWEYERALKDPDFKPTPLDTGTSELITRLIAEGERNETGQLSSYVLSDIGEALARTVDKWKAQRKAEQSENAA